MRLGHCLSSSDGRILSIDELVANALQRTSRELQGMSYLQITHPDDKDRSIARIGALRRGGPALTMRKRYIAGGGGVVMVDLHVSMITAGSEAGRLVGGFTILHEIEANRDPVVLWRRARQLCELDLMRRAVIGSDLSSDPAWMILLQIYLAEAEGRAMAIEDMAEVCDISQPLVERWLNVLCSRNLIEQPGYDRRISQLTPFGLVKLEKMLMADPASY